MDQGRSGADEIDPQSRQFDKRILARSKGEIEREVCRLTPLVEEGGYTGFCDHRPPDVPQANCMFYLETGRRVWGKERELRPVGQLVSE